MAINILMPALSPTMTEGKLAKWHVKEGDKVTSGNVICEIETDKATMEVEAVDEGIIGKIVVPEGTEGVAVNAVIAILVEEGEEVPAGDAKPAASAPKPAASPAPAAAPASAPQGSAPPQPATAAPAPANTLEGGRVFASPLAKRLAAEAGLDLSKISGSGPHGRIVKEDVEHAAKAGTAKPAAAPQPAAAKGPAQPQFVVPGEATTKIPHTSIRKVIARRMSESKQTVPHFYLTVDYEIDALLEARKALNALAEKSKGAKVSVNDMVIKACAMALRDHPDVNASWSEEAMIQYNTVDIAVAVATDRGLVTPIVRNADLKGLGRIAADMKDLASRAREGKLKLDEFQGGGFTISNLGMYGIKDFLAIINPPQAAILAVGAGEERVVVRDGQMVIRNIMSCSLSVDHRVVDGALGSVFLQTLRSYIEQPATMLL
ncbi:MAG: pyruvate dehydrogenase complex dihydrolipoamide acetyltransferase [Alphaproteobacteria bacterium]|nr:pyruvate dehydrogenase complex dihydrolipoamide acetyltransferase [Alphaproteobacteria bacterium]MCW5740025.1 pyruvate dehydrogenase complex dihydrolipoamide acetyltransferase [Alphaproteobacteria bacterium]